MHVCIFVVSALLAATLVLQPISADYTSQHEDVLSRARREGEVNVDVNRDRNNGQVVSVDGKSNVWKKDNRRVDVHGGADNRGNRRIGATYRWRRSADIDITQQDDVLSRTRREGEVNVDVNRDRNNGQVVSVDGKSNVWKKDNRRVDIHGSADNRGNRGFGATYRWRRSADFETAEQDDVLSRTRREGEVNVDVNRDRNNGQVVSVDGKSNVWKKDNRRVDVHGGADNRGNRRIGATYRWRRSADFETAEQDDVLSRTRREGEVNVDVNRDRNNGQVVSVDGKSNVWKKDNQRVDIHGSADNRGNRGFGATYRW